MAGVMVSISWCNRVVNCTYCEDQIEVASPMLVKKVWSRKNRRMYMFHYHLTCWIKEALEYLQEHPYQASVDSRKKLNLTDEERKLRRKLLAKRASIRQRMRHWESQPNHPLSTKKILDLLRQESKVALEINSLGGIPSSWGITWDMAYTAVTGKLIQQ